MNLNAVVAPVISAINPQLLCKIQQAAGVGPTQSDGGRSPIYATPGGITAAISDGTGLNPGNILTVSAIASGKLGLGQTLADTTSALEVGTLITGFISGTRGGIGTYYVNQEQLIAAEPMTTVLQLFGQVQPVSWRDLQQLEGLNITGVRKVLYYNGNLNGVVRVTLKGGDLVTLPDGSVWLVAMPLEHFFPTAGWSKAAMVLQDGS